MARASALPSRRGVNSSEGGSSWLRTRSIFAGSLSHASETEHAIYVERIAEIVRAEVEIVDVRMLVDEEDALAVREHEPFAIEVEVREDCSMVSVAERDWQRRCSTLRASGC